MKKVFGAVRLQEEEKLFEYFERILNLRAITTFLNARAAGSRHPSISNSHENRLSPLPGPDGGLYEACRKTVENFGFREKAFEFFVEDSPDLETRSILPQEKDKPYVVVFSRRLIDRIGQDELAFFLGHEIGHLVFNHSYVQRVFDFVFPKEKAIPSFLKITYDIWRQLGEMSADRIGRLACQEHETAVRAVYRQSLGSDGEPSDTSLEDLIRIAEREFEMMQKDLPEISTSRTMYPVRARALQIFHDSLLFKSVRSGRSVPRDGNLEEQMDHLVSVLKKAPLNEDEKQELKFLASAGLLLMQADQRADPGEYDNLVNMLSEYIYWPPSYLEMIERGRLTESLENSGRYLLNRCPGKSKDTLNKLFPIVIRDNVLRSEELSLFMRIGTEVLRVSSAEVSEIILEGIRKRHCPLSGRPS